MRDEKEVKMTTALRQTQERAGKVTENNLTVVVAYNVEDKMLDTPSGHGSIPGKQAVLHMQMTVGDG